VKSIMRGFVIALMLAAGGPAAAQELKFNPSFTEACLADFGWTECIGLAAQRCMEFTVGGYSTPVTNACLSAEHDWWDGVLNARYADLQDRARVIDSQPMTPGMPPRPSDAEALRDMQRAWIAFRDATCRFEELQWWGGTGASGAYLGCLMRMTGEQALMLQSYLAEG